MKEIEVLAPDEKTALEKGAAALGLEPNDLEIMEEYEPDEKDLAQWVADHNLEKPPAPDEITLYMLRVTLETYQKIAEEWTQGLIERFAPGSTAKADVLGHIIIIRLNVPESSILIGRRGATLDALQHVVVRALLTKDEKFPDVMLDVEGYREKKLQRLEREARRAADKALRTGRRQPLTPMTPAERKFIHKILREIEGIKTESRGTDARRHIVVESTNPRRGGRDGNRGPRRGPAQHGITHNDGGGITEEQRQLLYGKEMAAREEAEGYNEEEDSLEERRGMLPGWVPDEAVTNDEDSPFVDEIE
ncbi:MAG: hypothetical protein JJU11_17995 [Candidatus Sumerlaeia bacterium]|nr:hypothetical protein [Candidatus Sumerlaeia bacterium]